MEFLYIFSVIYLFIVFMVLKKNDNKENILLWIFLSFVITICYNVFQCYILSIIRIKCYLATLAIINIIIATIVVIRVAIKQSIQKYYFKWKDIIHISLLIITVLFVSYQRYGKNLDIKFESSDAATHYIAAKQFYINKVLLSNAQIEDRIFKFKDFMPAAYVNTGIIIDMFSRYISESAFYKLYIIFDIIIWYLSAVMFYFILTKKIDNYCLKIIGLLFTLIYIFAYPLNSMLFGFSYLSLGILIIECIIMVIIELEKEKSEKNIHLFMGFLLLFTLFFSYYLYISVVYTAVGIFLGIEIINNRKKVKIFSKDNLIKLTVLLIIPTVLGFTYFILPGLISKTGEELPDINLEGYIYRNLYSNFIIISPFILYYILDKIKNKKNDLLNTLLIVNLIIMILLFVGVVIGKVSTYYYYKMYFILWTLGIIALYRVIQKLYNSDFNLFAYSFIIVLICMHLFSVFNIDEKIQHKNNYLNINPSINILNDIYNSNRQYIKNTISTFSVQQKELLRYCADNVFEEKDNIEVCASNLQQRWIYAIYGVTDVNKPREFAIIEKKFNLSNWLKGNKKYYLYLKNEENEENIENIKNNKEFEILYKNTGGMIIKKNR